MDKKIIIIEDNEQDQKILKRQLSRAGYAHLTFVQTGEEGVALAEQQKPDLVLTDTILPGINGFETCRTIKMEKALATRVIIMTGQIDAVNAERAREAGADEYCVKTSDSQELIEAVRKILGAAEEGAEAPLAWGPEKTNIAIKALYKELEKRNEELRELNQLKSRFVATVSHELRTPLTIIKSAVGQVLDRYYGDITEEQEKKLTMALNSANLLKRIINDLLDTAKLEAKKVELQRENFDLVALAKEMRDGFSSLAEEKGLVIAFSSSHPAIIIRADRERIIQVLTNLIGNAVKFTEKGRVEIAVEREESCVRCRVADTGRGIAKEDLPKVSDRFEQFGKSYGPGQEGTGLGLSITKELVELHNGHISVESELDKGSTFIFTIPTD